MDQFSWSGQIGLCLTVLSLNIGSNSCKSNHYPARHVLHLTYALLCVLQIALVAADTFSCVQLFLSFLYLVSMETSGTGYYPSNALVSCGAQFSSSRNFVEFCNGVS